MTNLLLLLHARGFRTVIGELHASLHSSSTVTAQAEATTRITAKPYERLLMGLWGIRVWNDPSVYARAALESRATLDAQATLLTKRTLGAYRIPLLALLRDDIQFREAPIRLDAHIATAAQVIARAHVHVALRGSLHTTSTARGTGVHIEWSTATLAATAALSIDVQRYELAHANLQALAVIPAALPHLLLMTHAQLAAQGQVQGAGHYGLGSLRAILASLGAVQAAGNVYNLGYASLASNAAVDALGSNDKEAAASLASTSAMQSDGEVYTPGAATLAAAAQLSAVKLIGTNAGRSSLTVLASLEGEGGYQVGVLEAHPAFVANAFGTCTRFSSVSSFVFHWRRQGSALLAATATVTPKPSVQAQLGKAYASSRTSLSVFGPRFGISWYTVRVWQGIVDKWVWEEVA